MKCSFSSSSFFFLLLHLSLSLPLSHTVWVCLRIGYLPRLMLDHHFPLKIAHLAASPTFRHTHANVHQYVSMRVHCVPTSPCNAQLGSPPPPPCAALAPSRGCAMPCVRIQAHMRLLLLTQGVAVRSSALTTSVSSHEWQNFLNVVNGMKEPIYIYIIYTYIGSHLVSFLHLHYSSQLMIF